MSKRFDARFFVVAADAVTGTLAGSGELEDVRWLSVAEALTLDLANATRGVMAHLHDWLAWTPSERAARTRTPVMVDRVWQEE
jgi:8-oxo-dGTP pyrophosphatase MutT (NUDIX family)